MTKHEREGGKPKFDRYKDGRFFFFRVLKISRGQKHCLSEVSRGDLPYEERSRKDELGHR